MNSKSCFVPENTLLVESVEIIDVVHQSSSTPPIKPAQTQRPQRKIHSKHKDVISLKTYLKETAKNQCSCRYMYVHPPLTWQVCTITNITDVQKKKINMPAQFISALATNVGNAGDHH